MALNAAEQMDLLIKHLGPESMLYAKNLYAAHPGNPGRGLQLLWERLDERYSCPEFVLQQLTSKLESFPPFTYKNLKRLFDLADIVMQIQSLKENPTTSDRAILKSFDKKDLSEKLRDIDLDLDDLPVIGLSFDLQNDSFILDFPHGNVPATRRNLLSNLDSGSSGSNRWRELFFFLRMIKFMYIASPYVLLYCFTFGKRFVSMYFTYNVQLKCTL